MQADADRVAIDFGSGLEAAEVLAAILARCEGEGVLTGPLGRLAECLWQLVNHREITLDEWQRTVGAAIARELPITSTSPGPSPSGGADPAGKSTSAGSSGRL